ncbi:uncharacterized protein LOC112518455 [Cynara cardunculus var. scolymus]|uniref:WRC-like protein n=1 Tax=Cynara cardunculus var. scolymus TaxID=59895 RepID=A0A103XPS7_CYNCS|nr:uncharacterized protein LOC112518455 [Cynara cardunculus var. scolymus]KVH94688.1 WRC-like protein [Cynara cardunculus var. scolymus]
MRIRKRFLSLSAAAAVSGSLDPHGGDHHHYHHPPLLLVQHQQVHPNGNLHVLYDDTQSQPSDHPPNHCRFPLPPRSSDHTIQIGVEPSTLVSSGAGRKEKEAIAFTHKEMESESKIEVIKTHDAGRKESILCPEASSRASTPSPPTTASLVLKGWLEGDRLIPIKKRRGSFGKKVNHDVEEDHEIVEETMNPKTTKNDKCVAKPEVSATCPKKKNKNGKRGNVIMEGSRCSRVNGRGWRCCQQTLVGYSLCEHHLGKGRLRSMTSVRGRAQKVALKEQVITKERQDKEVEMISTDHHELEDDDDEEELKGWEEESKSSVEGMKIFSKKKKLGVVKARSLSSLLSQMGS